MTCRRIERALPGYLDGALAAAERQRVREHADACDSCREVLQSYARLSSVLSRVERPAPPRGLSARIRLELARVRNAEPWYARAWSRISLTFQNFLAPVAVPTTGGLMSAVIVFAFMSQSMVNGVPRRGSISNDVPIHVMSPASVVYLAPFPLSPEDDKGQAFEDDIIVETIVDAAGQAVSYEILAGPKNLETRRQLDQVVFFSKYRPQVFFGRAEAGGRVLLSFREIRVKG